MLKIQNFSGIAIKAVNLPGNFPVIGFKAVISC